jgi:hypothetical protein
MTFPKLSSGQIAQYSAVQRRQIPHRQHEFAGLGMQSQMLAPTERRTWSLRYTDLSGYEAMALRAFFESLALNEPFTFEDPWTGTAHTACRVEDNRVALACGVSGRYSVELEVFHAG